MSSYYSYTLIIQGWSVGVLDTTVSVQYNVINTAENCKLCPVKYVGIYAYNDPANYIGGGEKRSSHIPRAANIFLAFFCSANQLGIIYLHHPFGFSPRESLSIFAVLMVIIFN